MLSFEGMVIAAVVLVLVLALAVLWSSATPCNLERLEGEENFLLAGGNVLRIPDCFGNADDGRAIAPGTLDLSLVVPAYKETERLPTMMKETLDYLKARKAANPSFTYEIIVVDDGSCDGTTDVALEFAVGEDTVKVLQLQKNRGKGGAVRMGVLSSSGKRVLMVDADAATDINDLDKCDAALDKLEAKGTGIVCGSRAHLEDEAKATRSMLRTILMKGFHLLVHFLCVRGVRDTQCGFKLFSRDAAMVCFCSTHLDRWAFDVEMLYIAQQLNIPIAEVAVTWTEIDGSKLSPLDAALQMGRDLVRINALYMLGLWDISALSHKIASQM